MFACDVDGRQGGKRQRVLGGFFLHPSRELESGFVVGLNEDFKTNQGGGEILAVEDGADVCGHGGAHVETRNVGLSVLLKMELAALPRDGRKDGSPGGGEAAVGIADDEGEAVKAPGLERS